MKDSVNCRKTSTSGRFAYCSVLIKMLVLPNLLELSQNWRNKNPHPSCLYFSVLLHNLCYFLIGVCMFQILGIALLCWSIAFLAFQKLVCRNLQQTFYMIKALQRMVSYTWKYLFWISFLLVKIRISRGFHLGISLCLQQNTNFVFCTFSMSLNSFLKYFPTPLEISFSSSLSNSNEFYYTFSPSLYWQEALLPFGKHCAFTFFSYSFLEGIL